MRAPSDPSGARPPAPPAKPGTVRTIWLIGRRAALESLRDRATLTTSVAFALVLPAVLALTVVGPEAAHAITQQQQHALGSLMAVYLLIVGLGPSSGAISIASGVFAGEMEKGNLAPLLATPASNVAIFAGKVLGAVLPSGIYTLVAESTYLATIALARGPGKLRLLPLSFSVPMLLLVPVIAILAASIASLISSKVRSYTAAQTVSSLALLPIMGGLVGLAFAMRTWAAGPVYAVTAGLAIVDVLVVLRSATAWRREEIMAQR